MKPLSKSNDSAPYTNEPNALSGKMEALSRELSRTAPEPSSELASLRDFNAQLLERIGEFRKQNFELASRENESRSALAAQVKMRADQDRLLSDAMLEIESVRMQLNAERAASEQTRGELNRKLSRLSDEKWEADLDTENVRKAKSALTEEIERLKTESAQQLDERDRVYFRELESLRSANAELLQQSTQARLEVNSLQIQVSELHQAKNEQTQQFAEASDLLARLEEALEAGKYDLQAEQENGARSRAAFAEQMSQMGESFRVREAQLVGAFENLRAEYSSVDGFYKESTETNGKLRAEIRATEANAERALTELHSKLQSDFQRQLEIYGAENRKLQERVDAKDNSLDLERSKLQTWSEQIGYLDQHLQQVAATVKKERNDVLRLANQLHQDTLGARYSPFQEYLDGAEQELAQLQTQLNSSSALSPNRLKLELRFSQTTDYRDTCKTLLASVEKKFEERIALLQNIIKSASTPL